MRGRKGGFENKSSNEDVEMPAGRNADAKTLTKRRNELCPEKALP
jgi:hypothetical protein